MGAVRASDGAFLLGVMGAHTANAGKIYFPAGTPDPDAMSSGETVDLAGSVHARGGRGDRADGAASLRPRAAGTACSRARASR